MLIAAFPSLLRLLPLNPLSLSLLNSVGRRPRKARLCFICPALCTKLPPNATSAPTCCTAHPIKGLTGSHLDEEIVRCPAPAVLSRAWWQHISHLHSRGAKRPAPRGRNGSGMQQRSLGGTELWQRACWEDTERTKETHLHAQSLGLATVPGSLFSASERCSPFLTGAAHPSVLRPPFPLFRSWQVQQSSQVERE